MCRLLLSLLLTAAAAWSRPVTITLLATTDLHGNLLPVDYATNQPADRGLAKIATLVREVRRENPNTILIDCGDTIQGSPLETVYHNGPQTLGDPMIRAMNLLGYGAMTVGNHEYSVGARSMEKARQEAKFPWISANTTGFAPYVVKTVAGIRVAIVGVTTPMVPRWEPAENLGTHRLLPVVESVRAALAGVQADLIVVAAHSGLGEGAEDPAEHVVSTLAAAVPGIDAIVFGHSHSEQQAKTIGKVLTIQPKNFGASLARLDFTFEGKRLVSKAGRLIPVTSATAADPAIVALARPYEEATQRYLDTPVATSSRELTGSAIVDFINRVQLAVSKADESAATLFDPAARIPQGRVTIRHLTAIYPYDNELYVMEGPDGRKVAVNSYQASQPPYRGRTILWRSHEGIREMLIRHCKEMGVIP